MVADRHMAYRGGVGFVDPVTAMFVAQGIGLGVSWLFGRQKGQQKRSATAIVEEAGRLLESNLGLYERGEISQAQALDNFDVVWGGLVENCSPLGEPGRNCISERQAGSTAQCWINGSLESCDYFARWYDPIANDPQLTAVANDDSTAGYESSGFARGGTAAAESNTWMIVLAGALGAAALLVSR